jgi:3-oxoacyl-[acyl-carrier protein] reductase
MTAVRSALVTGAAQGLGRTIAEGLFAAGYHVALSDISVDVEMVATALDPTGERAIPVHLDVRDEAAFGLAFETAIASFGHVEVLVNNAARTAARPLWDISIDEWDDVLAVNLRGVFIGSRIAGLHMRERGFGRIVNIASIAGQLASPGGGAHYAAAKAGVLALTKLFAQELASSGVTVNAVAPSAIQSPMLDEVAPERLARLLASVPTGRFGKPEEVTAAVLYLASEGAGYTTGATIDVNGGRLMR